MACGHFPTQQGALATTTATAMSMSKKKHVYFEKQQLCTYAFLYIFSLSLHDYDVKKPHFTFLGERDDELFFLFLNLSAVRTKSTPEEFTYNWHFRRIGINATKLAKKNKRFSLPSPLSLLKLTNKIQCRTVLSWVKVWRVLSYYTDLLVLKSGQLISNQIWEFCYSYAIFLGLWT